MGEMILETLRAAWSNYLAAITRFLPRVLATISLLAGGALLAFVFRAATRRVLGWLRFERLAERTGLAHLLKKAELPNATLLAGTAVFWLVFAGFVLSGIDTLGFPGVQGLLANFVRFVPRLVVATLIVMVGVVAANFAWRATLLAAVNSNVPFARLSAGLVRTLILVLAVAMALEHLAVAERVVLLAFAIAFGAVSMGAAIAFGIGGSSVARRFIEQHFPERPPRADSDQTSHL